MKIWGLYGTSWSLINSFFILILKDPFYIWKYTFSHKQRKHTIKDCSCYLLEIPTHINKWAFVIFIFFYFVCRIQFCFWVWFLHKETSVLFLHKETSVLPINIFVKFTMAQILWCTSIEGWDLFPSPLSWGWPLIAVARALHSDAMWASSSVLIILIPC